MRPAPWAETTEPLPEPVELAAYFVASEGLANAGGYGPHGLADRVEALEGHLRLSSPSGAGTVVTADLPCRS